MGKRQLRSHTGLWHIVISIFFQIYFFAHIETVFDRLIAFTVTFKLLRTMHQIYYNMQMGYKEKKPLMSPYHKTTDWRNSANNKDCIIYRL